MDETQTQEATDAVAVVDVPVWILGMDFCHVCIPESQATYCGSDSPDSGPASCAWYGGEAICPSCGKPTCPRCAVLSDLADRLDEEGDL